jgi:hypothetical protein
MQRSLKIASVAVAVLTASALLYTGLKKKPEAPVVQPAVHKAAANTTVRSINLWTFSLDNMADSTAFWATWTSSVTGTCSGGEEYFPHADGEFVLSYFNTNMGLAYSTHGGFIDELNAFMASQGHTNPDPGCVHWGTLMKQMPPNSALWTLRPGWYQPYDANSDGIRDAISSFNHNWNQTNFTFTTSAPYYIRDTHHGKSGVAWESGTWNSGAVLIGSTEANAVTINVDRSNGDTIFLVSAPPVGSNFYVVDRARTWNHLRCAYRAEQARVGVYDYCEPGEGSCDTSWNTVGINFSEPDVRAYLAHLCAGILRGFRAPYAYLIGIHKDNCWIDWREDKCGWSSDFGDGMASILETGMNTQNGYCIAESLSNQAVYDSTHGGVSGPVTNEANIGTYRTGPGSLGERYGNVAAPLEGIMYETDPDGDVNYANVEELISSYQTERARHQKFYVMFKNSYYDPSSEAYRDSILLAIYCYYYAVIGHYSATSDTAGFIFPEARGYGNSTIDTASWLRGWAYANLGSPITPCSTISSMVYKRMYQNGDTHWIALFHPSDDQSVTVALDGGGWKRLKNDGTLNSSDNYSNYAINHTVYPALPSYPGITGRIFGKVVASSDSIIQYVTHKDTTTSSFTLRDSIIAIPATADSGVLWIATQHSFADSTKKAHFINVLAGDLQATGLNENTKYYFKCVGWNLGHSDFTVLDSITTKQTPAPPDTTKRGKLWLKKRH